MKNRITTGIFFFLFVLTAAGVFAAFSQNPRQGLPAISITSQPGSADETAEPHQGCELRLRIFTADSPVGFNGGMNLYRYADNNPMRWVDPWGLVAFYRFVQLWPGEGIYRSDFNLCLPNYWLEFVVKNSVGQLQQEVVYQANDLFSDPDFMSPTDPSRLDEFLGNIDASHKNRLREILLMSPGDANEAYDALSDYTKMRLGISYSSYWY